MASQSDDPGDGEHGNELALLVGRDRIAARTGAEIGREPEERVEALQFGRGGIGDERGRLTRNLTRCSGDFRPIILSLSKGRLAGSGGHGRGASGWLLDSLLEGCRSDRRGV